MTDPVVVVGGGIGGLTAAVALRHHGIECVVYEQAPELHEIGAGLGLWPAALAVFDRLGLGTEVRALGGSWEIAGLRRADGTYLTRYTAAEFAARLGEPTIGVHRGELQALLLRALSDDTVRTDCRASGIDYVGGAPRLQLGGGEVVPARALIGADGQRSVTRAHLFGELPLHDCRYISWRGTATPRPGTDWHLFAGESWGPRERFGILPISRDRVTWYATARAFAAGGGKAELLPRFRGWHHPIPALLEATDEADIWHDQIYDRRRPLRHWSVGSVTLLGDAAHPMTPELGQGACQAILDAWALARALATVADVPAALRAYERRRRRRAALVGRVARAMAVAGNQEGRIVQAVRERVMTAIPASFMLRPLAFVARG